MAGSERMSPLIPFSCRLKLFFFYLDHSTVKQKGPTQSARDRSSSFCLNTIREQRYKSCWIGLSHSFWYWHMCLSQCHNTEEQQIVYAGTVIKHSLEKETNTQISNFHQGMDSLYSAHVLLWEERISYLVDDDKWLSALSLALEFYEVGLPFPNF